MKLSIARRRAIQHYAAAGDFSAYLRNLSELPVSVPLVPYCRVSSGPQKHTLPRRKLHLLKALQKKGYRTVSKPFGEIIHGYDDDRYALEGAIEMARKHRGAVATHSECRFLRSRDWLPSNPDAVPTNAQFEWLGEIADGVPLVVLWSCELHWDTIKELEQEITPQKKSKRSHGARYSEADQLQMAERAVSMLANGHSWRQIEAKLNQSPRTLRRWVDKGCGTSKKSA